MVEGNLGFDIQANLDFCPDTQIQEGHAQDLGSIHILICAELGRQIACTAQSPANSLRPIKRSQAG